MAHRDANWCKSNPPYLLRRLSQRENVARLTNGNTAKAVVTRVFQSRMSAQGCERCWRRRILCRGMPQWCRSEMRRFCPLMAAVTGRNIWQL